MVYLHLRVHISEMHLSSCFVFFVSLPLVYNHSFYVIPAQRYAEVIEYVTVFYFLLHVIKSLVTISIINRTQSDNWILFGKI